jgi:hypothetical protein
LGARGKEWHLSDSNQFISEGLQGNEWRPVEGRKQVRMVLRRKICGEGSFPETGEDRHKGLANLSPKRIILLTQPEDPIDRPST